MHTARIVSRIFVVLGAAGVTISCGSSDSSTNGTSDAAADSSGGDSGSQETATDAGADVEDTTDTNDTNEADVPCVRRPFLVGATPRAGTIVARDDWSTSMPALGDRASMHAPTRRALAAAWREDGRQEHASIAAFARFAMLALAVGAPPEIVAASNRAGLDEIRHARGCFALADRYDDETAEKRGPGAISLEGALQPLCLAELAALTVHEGCVGETLGVLLASEQRARAKDPAVRAFLDRLVRDEMRHAELAWSFVRWAIATGGERVRRAVEVAFDEAIAATLAMQGDDPRDVDVDLWRAHGRLTTAEARALVRRGVEEIVTPCRGALGTGGTGGWNPPARDGKPVGDRLESVV